MNTKHRTITICSLAISILLFGCGLGQIVSPASTAMPKSKLLSSAQISKIQLDPLLFQTGDLPTKYTGATPTTTVPKRYEILPAAQKQSSEQISQNGSWVGDVTIFLFEKQTDIDQAFQSYAGKSTTNSDVGDKSVFTPFSIPYSGGSIDGAEIFFARCSAVVDIRLITDDNSEVSAFAKQLDRRLAPIVCNK